MGVKPHNTVALAMRQAGNPMHDFLHAAGKRPLCGFVLGIFLVAAGCAQNGSETVAPGPNAPTKPAESVAAGPSSPSAAPAAPAPAAVNPPKASVHVKSVPKQKPRPEAVKQAAKQAVPPARQSLPPAVGKPLPAPPAEQTAAAETPAAVESIQVDLDKLPVTIHDRWTVDRNEHVCVLQSVPVQMDDGQGGTPIVFRLTPDKLLFRTKSDIDLSYPKTGIRVDDGRSFALETVERRTDLEIVGQRRALLENMKNGHTLQVTMGFWPTWPVTHTYTATIPLDSFGTALQAWNTCNTLLRAK